MAPCPARFDTLGLDTLWLDKSFPGPIVAAWPGAWLSGAGRGQIGDSGADPDTRKEREDGAPRKALLIVEDDWLLALDNEAALLDAKFDVVGLAATAEEAVMLAAETRPDLVLMDVRLGGPSDGVEAAVTIRRQLDIPSLFLTAHSDRETRERSGPAGSLGWLVKPYTHRQLVDAINAA
jgi:two-component system, response regulator PdtaR